MLLPICSSAQQVVGIDLVKKAVGVAETEELDPDEVERLEDILRHPISINTSTVPVLDKSGLFTAFQIASLIDYRARHGDILSLLELSSLDGFSEDFVTAIAPFITIELKKSIGSIARTNSVQHDMYVRNGVRSDGNKYMYGLKYRIRNDCLGLSFSVNNAYGDTTPYPICSGNLSWSHSHGKIIVGDFNARLGQGLCIWNTAVYSGLTTPAAFMKKPSGVSSTFSFSGSSALTGVAADYWSGRWKLTAFISAPGIKDIRDKPHKIVLNPVMNVSRYGRLSVVSLTHTMTIDELYMNLSTCRIPDMKSSVDASLCIGGINIFGETAYSWVFRKVGAIAGTDFMAGESLRMAAMLKYLPYGPFSNEYCAALSAELKEGRWVKIAVPGTYVNTLRSNTCNFSAEASYYPESKAKDGKKSIQVKFYADWIYIPVEWLQFKIRISERLRTWGRSMRTDMRFDAAFIVDKLTLSLRMNALRCVDVGLLSYIEARYQNAKIDTGIRTGLFKIDDWDDRIYVYERDAPGNFNVPSYYGRGFWIASYTAWKYARWGRLSVRASYVDYPFMAKEKKKPGRAELKIQGVFMF